MIQFQQSAATFTVSEELFYQPCGEGEHIFVRIAKRDLSTHRAKRKLSEITGVPLKWISHAGMKDTLATAIQWLSWPEQFQRRPPENAEGLEILEVSRHDNRLGIGQVKANHFQLRLTGDGPIPEQAALAAPFPNFYGRQRFGRGKDELNRLLALGRPDRETISLTQSILFNNYLRQRLAQNGSAPMADDLWTNCNGKRWFQADYDAELQARHERGEVVPTGPIFGYKVALREDELALLGTNDIEPERFRRWGKSAKGARRSLFVWPDVQEVTREGSDTILSFSLPSGAYATVYLTHLFQAACLKEPETSWPDFTEPITLSL